MTRFLVLGVPLGLVVVRDIADGSTVIEQRTGAPVTRWRTQHIVPAPGAKAGAR